MLFLTESGAIYIVLWVCIRTGHTKRSVSRVLNRCLWRLDLIHFYIFYAARYVYRCRP